MEAGQGEAMTIDYRRLARAFGSGRPNPLKLVAGTALSAITEAPATAPAVLPDDDAAPTRAAVATESPPAPAAVLVNPVDTLLAALDAAPNDLERGYLLAAAPLTVREELSGVLAHHAMMEPPPSVALDTLMAGLDSAADDAQRAALLSAASRELRAELADRLWWRRVSVDDGQQRYLDMIK
jgi:hypothetical protein